MNEQRFKWETEGKALESNMIIGKKYRFTVLTDSLIRLEFDESGRFEDRASQSFFYRDFPQTEYVVKNEEDCLTIETSELTVKYNRESVFSNATLSISLKHYPGSVWHYGDCSEQLGGTASTLDLADGSVALEDGVCSRNGYAVIDDSETLLLTDDGWFDLRNKGTKDIYFFGYGHNYLECVKDLYRLTGAPPLLPDYALGNWWSRYYDYTQDEYSELIERFEKEDIPFSVAVLDMGWHTQEKNIAENRIDDPRYNPGWTGYTWNKELFPNYRDFLKFLKKHNLKTALNLHPAQGVGCNESMYNQMAEACGIDPKTKKLVKFDCLNKEFMCNYFDILHHPYEEDGVDFWWMDWQQGKDYWWIHDDEHPANPLEKMNPLWLLNHLHIIDISRTGKRPMFFSRYCGLGSHRYPVGFSGDTAVTWESLDFQPYFTANASNAGYSWWSHDIGGHMYGYRNDEMVVRWMQSGVFSPINRLHSAINWFTGKEPWNLHPYFAAVASKWLRIRHMLFPYIYTMNYRNHKDLIPMILPMYYTHPECADAYDCKNQFWFGSELIVSPITKESDKNTFLSSSKVWFPNGIWIDAFNGFVYNGDNNIEVFRTVEEVPVFGKAGAIVPMQSHTGDNSLGRQKNMELCVFAGADNSFTLYEDEGDYSNYKNGRFATTNFKLKWNSSIAKLTICPANGAVDLLPSERNWNIKMIGIKKPSKIFAVLDNEKTKVEFEYDEKHANACICLNNISITKGIELVFEGEDQLINDNANAHGRIFDILLHAQISYSKKTEIWEYINRPKGLIERLFMYCGEPEHTTLKRAVLEMENLRS